MIKAPDWPLTMPDGYTHSPMPLAIVGQTSGNIQPRETIPSELLVSATQIEAWRDCRRKWGWDKLNHIPRPSHRSAVLGSAIHAQAERWLLGQNIDHSDAQIGACAEALTRFLPPPPHSKINVEHKWIERLPRSDGQFSAHGYSGAIDLVYHTSEETKRILTIYDHKSTSNIDQWSKSEDDLFEDVQAIIYAHYACVRFVVDEVTLQWTYVQTKGSMQSPKCEPRRIIMTRDYAAIMFDLIDDVAKAIVETRRTHSTALTLPYNPQTCEKYGGCAYRPNCNLSPFERMEAMQAYSDARLK